MTETVLVQHSASADRKLRRQQQILEIEATCKKQEQVDVLVEHFFANGVYARQMYLPKDVLAVGKIHKFENICVVSQGKVRVTTDEGFDVITAPATFVGKAGVKRVLLALEDTIWTTFHTSIDDDLEKIEQHHIAPSYEDLKLLQENKHVMVNNSSSRNNTSINVCGCGCEQTCGKKGT